MIEPKKCLTAKDLKEWLANIPDDAKLTVYDSEDWYDSIGAGVAYASEFNMIFIDPVRYLEPEEQNG